MTRVSSGVERLSGRRGVLGKYVRRDCVEMGGNSL